MTKQKGRTPGIGTTWTVRTIGADLMVTGRWLRRGRRHQPVYALEIIAGGSVICEVELPQSSANSLAGHMKDPDYD
jgi:hypothetical protein